MLEPLSSGPIVRQTLLISVFCFLLAESKGLVVLSRPSGSEDDGLFILAKSKDLVVRYGDTVDLICKTNVDWHLCTFSIPGGETCSRLSENKLSTSCEANGGRLSYQVLYSTHTHNWSKE